jgi:hypothetical protein
MFTAALRMAVNEAKSTLFGPSDLTSFEMTAACRRKADMLQCGQVDKNR